MKTSVFVIGLLAASVMSRAFAQDELSPDEARDHAIYFTSLYAPTMGRLCAPLMPDYAVRLKAVLPQWRASNQDAIERGKQVEVAHLWPGKTIAHFEELAFDAIKDKFNAATREQQRQRCEGELTILSKGVTAVSPAPAGVAKAAAASSTPASAGMDEARLERARRLTTLAGLFEQEAQGIRFMIKGSPIAMPRGMADCTVSEARPSIESYFVELYGRSMTLDELDKALEFFNSATGQAVVNIRLQHLRDVFAAAERRERVASEQPVYPARFQREWDSFGKTPAGRFFVADEIAARPEVRTQVSQLRSEAFAKCLKGS